MDFRKKLNREKFIESIESDYDNSEIKVTHAGDAIAFTETEISLIKDNKLTPIHASENVIWYEVDIYQSKDFNL